MTNLKDWGLPPDTNNIPDELAEMARWNGWTAVKRGEKITKIPKVSTSPHINASTKKPETWGSLEQAYNSYEEHDTINGVGFVITDLTGFVFIDLDGVRDSDTGGIDPWAQEIVTELNSFTEISPSGTGLHIIIKGDLPGSDFNNHGQGIEMYGGESSRYLTITGHIPGGMSSEVREVDQSTIQDIYDKYKTSGCTSSKAVNVDMPIPNANAPKLEDIAGLDEIVRQYLVEGDAEYYDNDGSRALMGAAQTLYNMDYSDEDVLGILQKSPGAMATGLKRRQPDEEALKWIWKYTCLKARPVDPVPTVPAPAEAPEIKKAISATDPALFGVDGMLKALMNYMLQTSMYPQPIFALAGAVAFISLLIGNRFHTVDDIYCNLYIIAIGPTGCGKDFARKAMKWLADQYGYSTRIPDGIASGPGLEDYLMYFDRPVALLLLDEFGKSLQQFTGRGGDEHGVIGILLKLYTAVNSFYMKRLKAGGSEPEVIHKPFVSIYATTTAGAVHAALSEDDTEAGWLGRFLFLRTNEARPQWKTPKSLAKIPSEIPDWVEMIEAVKGRDIIVPYKQHAKERLEAHQSEIDEFLRSDTINPIVRAALVRVVEMVKKLSLISAISRDPEDPAISLKDVEWAIQLVDYSRSYVESELTDAIENGAASSQESQQITKCLDFIKRARSYGDAEFLQATKKGFMPHRMLQKKMHLKKRTLNECTDSLIESGQVVKASLNKEEHGINCETAYYISSTEG